VVAAEVRNLAQRSANAAKEIKALISDSVAKVDAGSKLVDSAGKTMEEIVSSVKRVSDIMGEISAASQEQRTGIEQVNTAVTQMDQITQQNAALVEEAAASAKSMEEQTNALSDMVAVFKLDEAHRAARDATGHRASVALTGNPVVDGAVRRAARAGSAPDRTAKADAVEARTPAKRRAAAEAEPDGGLPTVSWNAKRRAAAGNGIDPEWKEF
jgi:methyl-accepting chemotaxis protein